MDLLFMQCRGFGPYLMATGKCHGFSLVVVGTWGTLSSYSRDDPSKLVFVQRCQDSCLFTRDTSVIFSILSWLIGMLLKVRRETEGPFLVATVILGFLSIFSKSQATTTLKH